MARMKFLCDAERCIECNACVTACKNEHEVPWGINRRRVVTIQDGKPGERSISVACMHCSDAPCMAVCPVDCFYEGPDFLVIHPDECIDCALCEPECPIDAILSEDELPDDQIDFIEINARLSEVYENITEAKDPLPEADKYENIKNKRELIGI